MVNKRYIFWDITSDVRTLVYPTFHELLFWLGVALAGKGSHTAL